MGIERFGLLVSDAIFAPRVVDATASASAKLHAAADSLVGGEFSIINATLSEVSELRHLIEKFDGDRLRMAEFFADIATRFEEEFGYRLTEADLDKIIVRYCDETPKDNVGEVAASSDRKRAVRSEKITDDLSEKEFKYLQAYLKVGAASGASSLQKAVSTVFADEIREGAKPETVYAQSMYKPYRTRLTEGLKNLFVLLQTSFRVTSLSFSEEQIAPLGLSPNQYLLAKQILKEYKGQAFSAVMEMLEPKRGNGDSKKKKK
ncbi:hypothetical protein HY045_01430 [Candidatus Woesebacteria bacterium]|nr:hypothetical protein [Candidatus Woesebacteria bacterium]